MISPPENQPASKQVSPTLRRSLFLLAFLGAAAMLLILPRAASTLLFLAIIAAALIGLMRFTNTTAADVYRQLANFFHDRDETEFDKAHPPAILPEIPRRWLLAEIALVIVVACLATRVFLVDDPRQAFGGGNADWIRHMAYIEVEWQVHTAHVASIALHEKGYIPLWNPWVEFGHPLINNPQSIVFNPFSTGPALIFGALRGIKLGVVIGAILAGTGGWVLGRVLGFRSLGRVLLGLLIIGKGNMLAMLGTGYYPLGISQAYFPWIIAGTVAIVRMPRQRWPVALTALAAILMFWAGNIWYSLPLAFNIALLAAAHIFRWRGRVIHWHNLQRMIVMAVFALGIGAVSLLPIWGERTYFGDHPDEEGAGHVVDLGTVVEQYYNGSIELYQNDQAPGPPQFYYSYIAPLWFLALIFVIFPWVWPLKTPSYMHPTALPQRWRITAVGIFMVIFCTIWGAGGNPVMIWLYQHVPLLAQWRFVGRALAVGSFWIAVLVAMRVDYLWQAIWSPAWNAFASTHYLTARLQYRLAIFLVCCCAIASYDVIRQWYNFAGTMTVNAWAADDICISWLRAQNPDKQLAIFRLGYSALVTFFQNRVRETTIEADLEPMSLDWTVGHINLINSLPEYSLGWTPQERAFLSEQGYVPVENSPTTLERRPCLYRKTDALAYAYTIPLSVINKTYGRFLSSSLTTPITQFRRDYDDIRLWVSAQGREPVLVTVQELAFSGWEVTVDGQPVKLEVAGGQIATVLPPDNTVHVVHFRYRPPLLFIGGKITLISSAFFTLYLLRADRVPRWIGQRLRPLMRRPAGNPDATIP